MTGGNTLVICLLAPVTWAPPGADLARWRAALAEDVVDLLAPLPMIHAAIAAVPEDLALARSIAWPSMPILEVPRATPRAALESAWVYARSGASEPSAGGSEGAGRPSGGAAGSRLGDDSGPPGWGRAGDAGYSAGSDFDVDGYPTGAERAAAGGEDWILDEAEEGFAGFGVARFERAAVVMADAPDLPALLIGKLLRPLTTRAVAISPALEGGLLGVATRLPVPEWLPDLDPETGTIVEARAKAPEPGEVVSTPSWHRIRGAADLARLDPRLDGWETTRALLSA